jgi:hypothetical protein
MSVRIGGIVYTKQVVNPFTEFEVIMGVESEVGTNNKLIEVKFDKVCSIYMDYGCMMPRYGVPTWIAANDPRITYNNNSEITTVTTLRGFTSYALMTAGETANFEHSYPPVNQRTGTPDETRYGVLALYGQSEVTSPSFDCDFRTGGSGNATLCAANVPVENEKVYTCTEGNHLLFGFWTWTNGS